MKPILKLGLFVTLCMALWPALAGAAPPKPKGTLVYEDDFSDPKKSGLEENLQATDYSRGFHDPGVYHLRGVKSNDTRWELFPKQSYGNLTVELDVWDNSDEFKGDVSAGLVVRAQDDTHFYAVLIDPRKGQFAVRKLDGSTWSDLIAWKASPAIKMQSEINHLRVDAEGNNFTIYINDETLGNFSDASYAKGGIGLIASNVDAVNPHMHFDNIKVYTTEAAPAALPGTGQAGGSVPLLIACVALLLLGLGASMRKTQQ